MKKVNWNCPSCENQNTVDVTFYDFEMGLVLTDVCTGCNQSTDMAIDSSLAVTGILTKV